MKKKRKRTASVSVTAEAHAKIKAYADKHGLTIASVVVGVIERAIGEGK